MADWRRQLRGHGIELAERPAFACVNLRGDAGDAKFIRAVASVTDLEPPCEPNTSVSGLFASLIWLGPDEWLVTSETQRGEQIAVSLRQALKGGNAAVTEVGEGRIVYAVSGTNARAVLAKGCSIDLHPRVFGHGRCAQTLLGKAAVLLHQCAPDPVYDIHVARSFADYAWAWLENAAREHV